MTTQMNEVIRRLRRAALLQDAGQWTDGELLERFVSGHEGAVLEAIVRRHAPMVWGVCRRILRNHHDAEDAFQASFLVLVRKASSIMPRKMVGNWLYGVAHQTALKLRATMSKRQARERQVANMPELEAVHEGCWPDLLPLLDQELSRLPDKYRVAIVLCDLESKTRKEAARQLGCPEGTLAARLARARTMLAKRLARHCLAVSGGTLAAVLSHHAASACVPTSVLSSTINAATLFATGNAAATGGISAKVIALTEGVVKAMFLTKLKIATAVLTAVSLFVLGMGVLAYQSLDASNSDVKKGDSAKAKILNPEGAVYAIAWSPDGKRLVSACHTFDVVGDGATKRYVANGTVKIWDAANGELKLSLKEEKHARLDSVVFSPDGKTISVCLFGAGETDIKAIRAEVRTVDAETGELKQTIRQTPQIGGAIAFSPDGRYVACGGREEPDGPNFGKASVVKMYDLRKGELGQILVRPLQVKVVDGKLNLHEACVSALAFSPDGKMLATGEFDNKVRLWDLEAGEEKLTLEGHTDWMTVVAFSPDGKYVASAGTDMTVKLWEVKTGKLERTLTGHSAAIDSVAFTPDSNTLATAGARSKDEKIVGGEVKLWDVRSGELQRALTLNNHVHAVAFSPDGRTLAAGTWGTKDDKGIGEIKIWQLGREKGK